MPARLPGEELIEQIKEDPYTQLFDVGFPQFAGHQSEIRGSECMVSDELLLVMNRA